MPSPACVAAIANISRTKFKNNSDRENSDGEVLYPKIGVPNLKRGGEGRNARCRPPRGEMSGRARQAV